MCLLCLRAPLAPFLARPDIMYHTTAEGRCILHETRLLPSHYKSTSTQCILYSQNVSWVQCFLLLCSATSTVHITHLFFYTRIFWINIADGHEAALQMSTIFMAKSE